MDPFTIALLAAGGLLLFKGFSSGKVTAPPPNTSSIPALGGAGGISSTSGLTQIGGAPGGTSGAFITDKPTAPPDPTQIVWPPTQPNQPGYVTIGGAPAPASYSLGNLQTAIQATGVATSLAGGTLGVAGAIGGSSGAAGAIGATAASAIPIVGIGIAAVGLVLGIIAKHHAQAVALEAQSLNSAIPIVRQRQVLIAQAAVRGEINLAQADSLIKQLIADYYSMVNKTIQGKWAWVVGTSKASDKTPSGCNGPCVVGHWWVEGNSLGLLHNTIAAITTGQHGVLILQAIGSNAGFSGMPEIRMVF
jgi:hypothetical protein